MVVTTIIALEDHEVQSVHNAILGEIKEEQKKDESVKNLRIGRAKYQKSNQDRENHEILELELISKEET